MFNESELKFLADNGLAPGDVIDGRCLSKNEREAQAKALGKALILAAPCAKGGIVDPPLREICTAGMELGPTLASDSDDGMGMDVTSFGLVRVHAEHELVIGKLLVKERADGVGEGLHIGARLGRDDHMHRVARAL